MKTTKFIKAPEEDATSQIAFSERVNQTPRSYLREILKIASLPEMISFAGGTPNPDYFPIEKIKEAAIKVLDEDGNAALQYSTTEGLLPLREYIAERYRTTKGLKISAEEILITNGSQQGLDLIGKIFIDKGDKILMEKPSYLGAIQAFSCYQPEFYTADLLDDGIDLEQMETILWENKIKLFYTVPNFQNPTGISYSEEKRKEVAQLLSYHGTWLIEDSPYDEIFFEPRKISSFKKLLPERTILLGSFSKIISPGLRLGWIVCPKEIMNKIIVAKQASDLHSNFFSQKIIYSFLTNNDLENHLQTIRTGYKRQRDAMIESIKLHFHPEIKYVYPEGGMFVWIKLPLRCNTYLLIDEAISQGVAFVPGGTFYLDGSGLNTIRLSFANLNEQQIKLGIQKLSQILNQFLLKLP